MNMFNLINLGLGSLLIISIPVYFLNAVRHERNNRY